MEHGQREEIHLLLDDGLVISSSLCQCRICHEEEESSTMESPCACSGSLKFAHRGCIQRWCDEKGSTFCEICLQKFEPDYTIPPKVSQLVDVVVTIRGSLEVPRRIYEPQTSDTEDGLDYDSPECSQTSERGASSCRSIVLMVFLLRASGILLPFYLIMRLIIMIQHSQQQQRLQLHLSSEESHDSLTQGEEDVRMQQHRIQIHP